MKNNKKKAVIVRLIVQISVLISIPFTADASLHAICPFGGVAIFMNL